MPHPPRYEGFEATPGGFATIRIQWRQLVAARLFKWESQEFHPSLVSAEFYSWKIDRGNFPSWKEENLSRAATCNNNLIERSHWESPLAEHEESYIVLNEIEKKIIFIMLHSSNRHFVDS